MIGFSNSLLGERLQRPLLKFDSVVSTSVHRWPMSGMSLYGPYDKSLMQRKSVRFAILYPEKHGARIGDFEQSFKNGLLRYPGYAQWFRQNIEGIDRYPITEATPTGYASAVKEVLRRTYDLVFVVTEGLQRPNPLYQRVKADLLKGGIPSQCLDSVRLYVSSDQLQWVLGNVSLSVYAKIGGTPWVIEAPDQPEVILGISRALDPKRKVIVGFAVLFKQNGDFVLSYSKPPVTNWIDYEKGIEDLVYETISEYRKIESDPSQIVFHFTKNPGKREIDSITSAIDALNLDAKYALVHLNDSSGFRLFDTSHQSYVPYAGLKVHLSNRESLLLLDGRDPSSNRAFLGTPSVLDITFDKRSTVDQKEYPRIVNQAFNLAFVNWRGFNARTIPVTINYAYLIAKLISELESTEDWGEIIARGNLIDKAWFL